MVSVKKEDGAYKSKEVEEQTGERERNLGIRLSDGMSLTLNHFSSTPQVCLSSQSELL